MMALVGLCIPLMESKRASFAMAEKVCISRRDLAPTEYHVQLAEHIWNFVGTLMCMLFSGVYCYTIPYSALSTSHEKTLDRKRKLTNTIAISAQNQARKLW
jgi:hypothetical protein